MENTKPSDAISIIMWIDIQKFLTVKAELLQEGIFPHPFIFQNNSINETVENGRN